MPFSALFAFEEVRYKVVPKSPYYILHVITNNKINMLNIFNTLKN